MNDDEILVLVGSQLPRRPTEPFFFTRKGVTLKSKIHRTIIIVIKMLIPRNGLDIIREAPHNLAGLDSRSVVIVEIVAVFLDCRKRDSHGRQRVFFACYCPCLSPVKCKRSCIT